MLALISFYLFEEKKMVVREEQQEYQVPFPINLSLKNFYMVLWFALIFGYMMICVNLANNANITPTAISTQVYATFFVFMLIQVLLFGSYYLLALVRKGILRITGKTDEED